MSEQSVTDRPQRIGAAVGFGLDPNRPVGRPRVWYRRRGPLLALVVAAILAVTVVTDLPQHTSRAAAIAQERSVVEAINTDAGSCTFSVGEAFRLYNDAQSPSLAPSNRMRIPGLLRDDQAACSFTNNDIFNLSGIETPGSAPGREMSQAVSTVTTWTTSDALAAIIAIETLVEHPSPAAKAKALATLDKAERFAAEDRAKLHAEVDAANRLLRAHLGYPKLPVLPERS
ncbi:MAG: hypothetical protein M0004_10215 [Actinomycetota bacterium]|nr:hypothetical protein [Actinomycetota bacterium]